MARGNLSIMMQIGIVVGGFGLAFAVLYFSLWLASQPPARVPVDQDIIDYNPPAH